MVVKVRDISLKVNITNKISKMECSFIQTRTVPSKVTTSSKIIDINGQMYLTRTHL